MGLVHDTNMETFLLGCRDWHRKTQTNFWPTQYNIIRKNLYGDSRKLKSNMYSKKNPTFCFTQEKI